MTSKSALLLAFLLLTPSLTQMSGEAIAKQPDMKLISQNDSDANKLGITDFQCGTDPKSGAPTTFAYFYNNLGQKRKSALLIWTTKYIKNPAFPPERRCKIISKKLSDQLVEKPSELSDGKVVKEFRYPSLKIGVAQYTNTITGEKEEAKVVCFANSSDEGSSCDGRILMTLSESENPSEVRDFLTISFAQASSDTVESPLVRGRNKKVTSAVDLQRFTRRFNRSIQRGSVMSYPAD